MDSRTHVPKNRYEYKKPTNVSIFIKQTLASLRLNEFKLTALTTSNGKLFHMRLTLLAKLNLRTSTLLYYKPVAV